MSDQASNLSSQQSTKLNLPPCGRHILLVEDNEDARNITLELLEMLGHYVVAVASAEAALERLDMDQPEILLTDISLPAMSGIDLALLARQRHPHLSIIFTSGYEQNNVRLPDVAAFYLLKPYSLAQLEQALGVYGEHRMGQN